jgi:Kef-type K+ transport system membrane component KefB
MTDLELTLRFLLQLATILIACRVIGWLGRRYLGQTQVVMEMVTGVMLGPSLMGILVPDLQAWLFPKRFVVEGFSLGHPSMSILYVLSQLGLSLYMFLVGLEFDTSLIQKRARGAIAVSLAGILAPFILGGGVGMVLHRQPGFFGEGVRVETAALYLGAAMCITAFPMLARIIYERGLAQTSMGTLALGAGASDDVVAWATLAVVLATNRGTPDTAILAIGGGLLFAGVTFGVLKPFAYRPLARWFERQGLTPPLFVTTIIAVILSAWLTDAIGVYAVFGAFLTGAAMPKGEFSKSLQQQLEMPVTSLLLPLFFVYSGLNTRIGLVDSPWLWGVTLVVCVAAVAGKGLACALAARWIGGESWRESWTIGTLMNARGLMELIILNIALQGGIITPTLFTIMVIMAIVTTLMASPLFSVLYERPRVPAGTSPNAA